MLGVVVAGLLATPQPSLGSGPELREPRAELAAALECPRPLADSKRAPVLLIHGTGASAKASWENGYPLALALERRPSCTVQLPSNGLVDLQRSSEYVVHAIRRMHRLAGGRRVDVIGHSQGGLEPVWALRFWRGLRSKVSDVVALGTPYQGIESGQLACTAGVCPEAYWQFEPSSKFLAALNRGDPTPRRVQYTSIYTEFDQVVRPPGPANELPGAGLVSVQGLCEGRPVDHFFLADDAATYALASFALGHRGRFDAADVPPGDACTSLMPPGVNPLVRAPQAAALAASLVESIATAPLTNGEPRVRCYARPRCARR